MRWSAAGALGAVAIMACRGAVPPARHATRAATTAATAGAAGDTALFAPRILSVARNPVRATYELGRPAYVTVLSVDDKAIESIAPVTGRRSEIAGTGVHVASLGLPADRGANAVAERFGPRAGLPEDLASAAALMEYNRCVSNARQQDAKRRTGPRPVIGRDSSGAPIYGPPTETAEDINRSLEKQCKLPTIGIDRATEPGVAAKPGRYLLLYASDTPIEFRDVTDLVVTAAEIRATARLIGEKLFGVRGARWSVSYMAW